MVPSAVLLFYAANVHVSVIAIAVSAVIYWWPRRNAFLNRRRKRVRILEIAKLANDTKRFRLALDHHDRILGLPVGKHIAVFSPNPKSSLIYLCGKWNGQLDPDGGEPEVQRCYTPITGNDTLGYFDIVVKIYRPGTIKMPDGKEVTFSDGGKTSLFLDSKKIGDEIEIDGPMGANEYLGRGCFRMAGRSMTAKRVGMIAGGTGITPMLQILRAALRDPDDTTCFSLLYANQTDVDILFRDALDEMATHHSDRFQVHYTVDCPSDAWEGSRGFISRNMIERHLPASSSTTLILMCGPPTMIEQSCKPNLLALGFEEKATFVL